MAKFSMPIYTYMYVTAIADGRTRFYGEVKSTSNLRIFGVQKPISDVKTPKTSTSASAGRSTF